MPTETKLPDAILEQSGWSATPAVTSIDEDPDTPGSDWIVAASTTTDPIVRVSFPTPTGTPTGVQTFKAYVRKNGGSGTPTARIDLYDNGSLIASGADTNITSTSGQLLTQTFDLGSTPLTNADGSTVEARLVIVHAGGSPSARASVDLNAIDWDIVNYSSANTYTDSATIGTSTTPSSAENAAYIEAATISTKTSPSSSEVYESGPVHFVTSTEANGTDLATLSYVTHALGNLLVLQVSIGGGSAPTINSITGGGVDSWTQVEDHAPSSGNFGREVMLIGKVNNVGSQSITINFTTAVGGHIVDIQVLEFTANDVNASWTVYSHGQTDTGSSNFTTIPYASLTTPADGHANYIGLCYFNANYINSAGAGASGDPAVYIGAGNYYSGVAYILNATPSTAEVPVGSQTLATSTCSVSAIILYSQLYTDSAVISGVSTPSDTDVVTDVESAVIGSVTTPSSVELHEIPDVAVVATKTTPSSTDVGQFVESAIITTTTSPVTLLAGVSSPSVVNSTAAVGNSVPTISLAVPSSTQAGDVLTIFYMSWNGSDFSTPSGWTLSDNEVDTSGKPDKMKILQKIASSGDLGTSVTLGNGGYHIALMVAHRNGAIGNLAVNGPTDALSVTGPSLTRAYSADRLLAVFCAQVSATTTPNWFSHTTGMTEIRRVNNTSMSVGVMYDINQSANGPFTAETWSYSNNPDTNMYSWLIDIVATLVNADVAAYLDATTIASATVVTGVDDYTPASGTEYDDAATVGSITTPSSVDNAALVEAGVVNSITVVSSVELYAAIESAVITTTTNVSGIDVAVYVDSNIVTFKTTPSSTEVHEIPDSAIISSKTTPSIIDILAAIDAATVTGSTNLSSTEIAQFVDAATVATTTTLAYAEIITDLDAATITAKTTPASVDVAAYIDASTIPSATSLVGIEGRFVTDAAIISGVTSLLSADVAIYIDGATPATVTNVSSIESHELPDAAIITTTTNINIVDVAAYVDAASVPTTTALLSVEIREIPDADTITTQTIISYVDLAAYVDGTTIANTTAVVGTDEHVLPDSATVITTTSITTIDVAAYVDADTPIFVTTPISVEERAIPDADTISTITNVSTIEFADYVDSDTIPVLTYLTSAEGGYADVDTIQTVTTPSGADIVTYVDDVIIETATSVNTIEFADYIDGDTVDTLTALSTDEQYSSAAQDATTIPTITSISYSDIVSFIDLGTPNVVTTLSSIEKVGDVDSGNPDTTTNIVSADVAVYTEHAATSTMTTLSGIDVVTYLDTDFVKTTTVPSSVDTTTYIDSATISSTTTYSGIELLPGSFVDTATIDGVTSIISTDLYYVIEGDTPYSVTTPGTIEEGIERPVVSYTIILSDEFAYYIDGAIIPTTTTIGAAVVGIIVQLSGFAKRQYSAIQYDRQFDGTYERHFTSEFGRRWYAPAIFRKWVGRW